MSDQARIPIYLFSAGMVFASVLILFALFLITMGGDIFFSFSLILFALVTGLILVISSFVLKYIIEARHNHRQFKLKSQEKAGIFVAFLFVTLSTIIATLPIGYDTKVISVIVALLFSVLAGYDIGTRIFKKRRVSVS